MVENNLDVTEVSAFLNLPEPVRWQVLFFGLIGIKKSVKRLTSLGWAILSALLLNGFLIVTGLKI